MLELDDHPFPPGARFTNLRRYVVVVRFQIHVDLRITPTLFHITQLASLRVTSNRRRRC